MNEQVKYLTKLSSLALFSWLKINVLGVVNTIITFPIGLMVLITSIGASHAAHSGSGLAILMFFLIRPLGSILLILILLSPILYLMLGNKYVIAKLINKLAQDKSEAVVNPLLDKVLSKTKSVQPELMKKGADYSMVKLKLVSQVKYETENKWLNKAVLYALDKVHLSDVDFSNEHLTFDEIIKFKVNNALQNMTAPSRKSIWLVLGAQWLCVVLIWLLPY